MEYMIEKPKEMAWEESYLYAKSQGVRLPSFIEAKIACRRGPLIDGDIWVPVGDHSLKGYMYIGS